MFPQAQRPGRGHQRNQYHQRLLHFVPPTSRHFDITNAKKQEDWRRCCVLHRVPVLTPAVTDSFQSLIDI